MNDVRFDYILRLYGIYRKQEELGIVRLGLVMEYMENGSISSLTRRIRPLPRALQFRILHEVAVGMNYLHGLNPPLLHLDLKPSNVLLDESFHVKLTDFGLSEWKKASVKSKSSTPTSIGGTWPYMPPEAFSNLNYKPNQNFDVYSYGILIWSVITGEEPYSHVMQFGSATMTLVQEGQRPDMTILPEDVPSELKVLMQQCWSQEECNRHPFKECIRQIREMFDSEAHKSEVQYAVRRVQDALSGNENGLANSEPPDHREDVQYLDVRQDSDHGSGAASGTSLSKDRFDEDQVEQYVEKLSNVSGVLDHLAVKNMIKGPEFIALKDGVMRSKKVQNTVNPLLQKGANVVGTVLKFLITKTDSGGSDSMRCSDADSEPSA
ncbi:receptor-interacting serine/threonine-protein kinase 2-like isoform X2 [Protopterus annectens]|nr:receptor-interacting serine/threonine-protein kinase 2-like isoform X2 [Protopterus annectens]